MAKSEDENLKLAVGGVLEKIMSSPVRDKETAEKLKKCGFAKSERNLKAALVYELYELAKKGNSKAVDVLMSVMSDTAAREHRTVITVNLVDGEPCVTKKIIKEPESRNAEK